MGKRHWPLLAGVLAACGGEVESCPDPEDQTSVEITVVAPSEIESVELDCQLAAFEELAPGTGTEDCPEADCREASLRVPALTEGPPVLAFESPNGRHEVPVHEWSTWSSWTEEVEDIQAMHLALLNDPRTNECLLVVLAVQERGDRWPVSRNGTGILVAEPCGGFRSED